MGAPKGSKNALGNKGGGRKPAYVEEEVKKILVDFFMKGMTIKEAKNIADRIVLLKTALTTGLEKGNRKTRTKISGKDLYLYKLLAGKDKYLLNLVNKLVGDKLLVGEDQENKFTSFSDAIKKITSGYTPPQSTIPEKPSTKE